MDELLAADTNFYFPEPTYFRLPSNTDDIFEQYIRNPEPFEEFEISKEFIGTRYTDLKNDLRKIMTEEGNTSIAKKKSHYYKGMVNKLSELFYMAEHEGALSQVDLVDEYNELAYKLKNTIRRLDNDPSQFIFRYYFYKGQQTILKQIILNTPLMLKQEHAA